MSTKQQVDCRKPPVQVEGNGLGSDAVDLIQLLLVYLLPQPEYMAPRRVSLASHIVVSVLLDVLRIAVFAPATPPHQSNTIRARIMKAERSEY